MKQLAINMLGETVDVFSSWSAQSPSFRVEVSKKNESHTDEYSTKQVSHFDKDSGCISRMRRVMKVVSHFALSGKSGNQEMLQTTGMTIYLLSYGVVLFRMLCPLC